MKVETAIFGIGTVFFLAIAVIYGFVTGWNEPVGATALLLTAALSALIGFYLGVTGRRIDPRPEDDPLGDIIQGSGEQGQFAPYSWWPFPLALGAAICFLGLAVGWWLVIIGLGVSALALVGWVYEFYRGEHAH